MTEPVIATRRRRRTHGDPDVTTGTRRFRDSRFDSMAVKVFPGEHYVTSDPHEMLVTVLGSCVSACIRDPGIGVGGMNHFMLPQSAGSAWDTISDSMRYGNVAMERLINDILVCGGMRQRLEVKVFGGANVLKGCAMIGDRNADFVEHYLAAEGIPVVASHLRGTRPRRVHYFPVTGRVLMLELPANVLQSVIRKEVDYKSKVDVEPVAGSIELFEDQA